MKTIKCALIGASGYTGLELVKILLNHPNFTLNYVATSSGDTTLDALHGALAGITTQAVEKADAKDVAKHAELAFLALPHKTAMGFTKELMALGVKVVDLSADYRLSLDNYEANYCEHLDKDNLAHAVYGLPELYKKDLEQAKLVANPGCYPTATLLGLLPFAKYLQKDAPIFIDAKSGVSGAGKKCSDTTHFVKVNENMFAYNPLKHRHQIEIKEKLDLFNDGDAFVNFVPNLCPITRGMLVSAYVTLSEEIDALSILEAFYKDSPFVRVRTSPVEMKNVAGTNFCDIFVGQNKNVLFINSAIDNLLRGASSQAVVNANLMCGLEEGVGIPTIAYVP